MYHRSVKIIQTLIIFLYHFSGASAFFLTGVFLKPFSSHLNTTVVNIGYSYLFKCLGVLLSTFIIGKITDLSSRVKVLNLSYILAFGVLLETIAQVILAFVTELWMFYVAQVLLAIGLQILLVVTTIMIKNIWKDVEIKLWNGKYTFKPFSTLYQFMWFIFSFGSFVFPLFSSWIFSMGFRNETNIKIVFLVSGILNSVNLLIVFFPIKNNKKIKNETIGDNNIYRLIYVCLGGLFLFSVVALSVLYGQIIGVFILDNDRYEHYTDIDAPLLITTYYGSVALGKLITTLKTILLPPSILLFIDVMCLLSSVLFLLLFNESYLVLWIITVLVGIFQSSLYGTEFLLPKRFNFDFTGFEASILMFGGSIATAVPFIGIFLMSNVENYVFLYLFSCIVICNALIILSQYIVGSIYMRSKSKTPKLIRII